MTTILQNDTLPLDNGQPDPGVICVANESRFNAAHLSEPLTAFTVGWRDPENLDALINFIAPAVPVARRFEFRKADNAEAFLTEDDDIRAIGAPFKRVKYHGESVNEKTFNKGLTIRVDHDEVVGDGWQERYVQLLLQRLQRNELRRAVAALDSADASDSKVWDSFANPDTDLRAMMKASADASGIRPNRMLFGEVAWDVRMECYDVQNTSGGFRAAMMSPTELAKRLFVEDIKVVNARYQGAAAAKSEVLGSSIYAYYASPAITKDEPSNLKRFYTPSESGTQYRVYAEEHAKYTDISVEHYSNIVVTSDLGVRKLTVSLS